MCTPLPVRGPRPLGRRRELDTPSVRDIHKGTIVPSVRVEFTGAQQEGEVINQDSTVILRRSTYGRIHTGQRDVVGELYEHWWRGEGGGSALGYVVPRDPLV